MPSGPGKSGAAKGARAPQPQLGEQMEMFPREVLVEALDPRERVGPRTSVTKLFRVRWTDERRPHLVFVDRYGTYCEEHGKECPAVRVVVERAKPGR